MTPEAANQYLDRSQQELLETWYDEFLRSKYGIGYAEATSVASDLKVMFDRWTLAIELPTLLCQTWCYCEKRRSLQTPMHLATAMVEFLSPKLGLDAPGAWAVAALVMQHGADHICGCP
jgi:hypothetical protein